MEPLQITPRQRQPGQAVSPAYGTALKPIQPQSPSTSNAITAGSSNTGRWSAATRPWWSWPSSSASSAATSALSPKPRIYQAHATLEIQGVNEDFLNMRNVNPNANASYSPDYDIQTQVRILQSRGLLKSVYDKLATKKWTGPIEPPDRLSAWRKALKIQPPTTESLWQEALAMAAGSVRVRASGMNRIVDLSCDSTNPQVAAEFLNVLSVEYIQQNLEARWKSTEHTGEWLTNQLHDIKIKLEKSDDQLQAYARTARLTITDEKNNVDEEKLRQLQKDLSAAESDRVGKQSKYEMANSSPLDALPDVVDDQNLASYQSNLTELRSKLAQLRTTFTPAHIEVKKIQARSPR